MPSDKRVVEVDADFIKNLMPKAPALFTAVYLYALGTGENAGVGDIAEGLNMQERDVSAALLYWQDRHIVKLINGRVSFAVDNDKAEPEDVKTPAAVARIKETPLRRPVVNDEQPHYQPEELSMYADKNADVRGLFEMAQNKLGRMLTHNDLSSVFSLYHWLGLKMEVIELLLDFCVERGHRNMRYIERVAVDWCESGITDEEKARERIYAYNTVYRNIMRAMGQSGREPVSGEVRYMRRWVTEYNMDEELIRLACAKTVMNTGKASFGYADKIIEAWHKAGFKNTRDVEESERAFAESRKSAPAAQKPESARQPKAGKFVNYSQRNYDYSEIKRLEMERLKSEGNT
ncbi:DnaD domain protein [Lachnospiraceae bacterium NSJ-143]|nr:DnaD domain protein [Lachnospiraceae bacterium NSJ-143]